MVEPAARSGASRSWSLRRGLWPLAKGYGLLVRARNRAFDRGWRRTVGLPVPVVSVGNLTVGGTGKTPLVVWLVARACAAGRRPGVLARGYRRRRGEALNDEGRLLQRRFPGLLQVQDPDRVRGGAALVAAGADYLILDDGFQHRRLRRDVDIVCLDARDPFAGGRLLPAGDLREPPAALRRAQIGVLTRAGGLALEELAERVAAVRRVAPGLVVFAAEHRPQALHERPAGGTLAPAALCGRRVLLLSAIGNPSSFERTVRALGAEVVGHVARRDHAAHDAGAVAALAERARALDAWLVTTEKDDVKLDGCAAPRHVLAIGIEFLGEEPAAADLVLR